MCARLTCLLAFRQYRDVNKRHKIYCFVFLALPGFPFLLEKLRRKKGVGVINVVVEVAILRSVVFKIQVRIEYTV